MNLSDKIKNTVRNVPDFPKLGINFKDISPIVENPTLSKEIVKDMAKQLVGKNIDAIVGVESRGFIYGMPLALELNVPFVLLRKVGKLPFTTIQYSYDLEYGSATLEMHVDSIKNDWNVFIHDDLLATGGTAIAAAELVQQQGGKVAGFGFIIELAFLEGAKRLEKYSKNIINLATY
ncbi:MAG: adenine phosphoribosyltransferase [Flavobacteriales bacterium]